LAFFITKSFRDHKNLFAKFGTSKSVHRTLSVDNLLWSIVVH